MDFSLIGIRYSKYFMSLMEKLIEMGLRPYYVIIEDIDKSNLANGAYIIDNGIFESYNYDVWSYDKISQDCVMALCMKYKIPFFVVSSHNNWRTSKVLDNFSTDILLITEGPIITGEILYKPRICTMNIHAAPLPGYRGNWTTRLALYNDEPPMVSAHVVTSWVDQGSIINRKRYSIDSGNTLTDIDAKALNAAIELACETLKRIKEDGLSTIPQFLWEGKEYRGTYKNGILQPAMPEELQRELEKRLANGEYGFYS